jgi:hypothetical protein
MSYRGIGLYRSAILAARRNSVLAGMDDAALTAGVFNTSGSVHITQTLSCRSVYNLNRW